LTAQPRRRSVEIDRLETLAMLEQRDRKGERVAANVGTR